MKLFFFFLGCATVAGAAPKIEQTLDQNLAYVRIDVADTEQAGLDTVLAKPALALDLRGTTGTPDAIARLAKRLEQPPKSENAHRLVLISGRTPPTLTEALRHNTPGQITLAARQPSVTPDIAVASTIEEDDKAFAAAENGTPIEKLIVNEIEKKRFDETTLAHDRNAIDPDDGPDVGDETPDTVEITAKGPTKPHDRVLERAVQVHEGLLVLRQ